MFQKSKCFIGAGTLCLCLALFGCSENTENKSKKAEEIQRVAAEDTQQATAMEQYTDNLFAMDTYMSLTAYGMDAEEAVKKSKKEIQRLDNLWSISSKEGEIYNINHNGSGVVSADTAEILERAATIYNSTNGAFDITVYPLMKLWGFTTGNYKVPKESEIKETLTLVNQTQINLDTEAKKVTLGKKQKIDLGGIAKGFTSNRVMEIWKKSGITSGMVTLGGNVQVLGSKSDGSPWKVGIRNPESTEGDMVGILQVTDCAVITSGGYERYFEEAGKEYHHILDTRTGYPAENGLISVTIVSQDGTLADGLSTALFVKGKEGALAYWKQHKEEFNAVLVEENGEIYVTEGLEDCFSSEEEFQIIRGDA